MRIIKVVETQQIEVFDKPTEEISPERYAEIMDPVLQNKYRILSSANDTEHLLEEIIENHLFGNGKTNTKEREDFRTLILESDWFTFSNKRKTVMQIINQTNIMKGNDKNDYDKLLKNIISYRNIFTHGVLSTDGLRVCIKYFESTPQRKFLNDEYFEKIEKELHLCIVTSLQLSLVSRVSQSSRSNELTVELE
jgi:hypothetical protein